MLKNTETQRTPDVLIFSKKYERKPSIGTIFLYLNELLFSIQYPASISDYNPSTNTCIDWKNCTNWWHFAQFFSSSSLILFQLLLMVWMLIILSSYVLAVRWCEYWSFWYSGCEGGGNIEHWTFCYSGCEGVETLNIEHWTLNILIFWLWGGCEGWDWFPLWQWRSIQMLNITRCTWGIEQYTWTLRTGYSNV